MSSAENEAATITPSGAESKEAVDDNSNKRPLSPSSDKKEEGAQNKKQKKPQTKKEAGQKHTRREPRDWNSKDPRERPPHEGSFANEALRKQFGVTLDGRLEFDDEKLLKRKAALLLGFLGTKYGGFQVNMNQRTLQSEVELALFKAGMLKELNFGRPFKYSWSTSARTDKGVHACAQVCSLKVELLQSDLDNMEEARQRLEGFLPSDIRVLDFQRVTRNFCAKTQRDRVRYQYMIPSFLLHSDYRALLVEQGIPLEGRRETARAPLSKDEVAKLQEVLKGFRTTDKQRGLLQAALKKYDGTHPFHNFTKGLKPGQASANRYIESFRVQDPVIIDGLEWIPTQVLGQSFLLHQIRKMIAMAVDVTRGAATLEVMDRALSKKEVVRVGLAPAQGLFLELSFFGGYNRRKQQNKDLPNLDWSVDGPAKDRWAAFRDTIREHIVKEEEAQGNFVQYLYVQECIFEAHKFYNLDGTDCIKNAGREEDAKDSEEKLSENSGSDAKKSE